MTPETEKFSDFPTNGSFAELLNSVYATNRPSGEILIGILSASPVALSATVIGRG